jgi:hypothetical protein
MEKKYELTEPVNDIFLGVLVENGGNGTKCFSSSDNESNI